MQIIRKRVLLIINIVIVLVSERIGFLLLEN